jgi:hypothetical protein
MNRLKIFVFTIMMLAISVSSHSASTVQANVESFTRIDGEIRGYPYTLIRPDDWNGDLVLLVRGSAEWWFEIIGLILAEQVVAYATSGEDTGPGQMASFYRLCEVGFSAMTNERSLPNRIFDDLLTVLY